MDFWGEHADSTLRRPEFWGFKPTTPPNLTVQTALKTCSQQGGVALVLMNPGLRKETFSSCCVGVLIRNSSPSDRLAPIASPMVAIKNFLKNHGTNGPSWRNQWLNVHDYGLFLRKQNKHRLRKVRKTMHVRQGQKVKQATMCGGLF